MKLSTNFKISKHVWVRSKLLQNVPALSQAFNMLKSSRNILAFSVIVIVYSFSCHLITESEVWIM